MKLLNCPFCGAKVEIIFAPNLDGQRKYFSPEIFCSGQPEQVKTTCFAKMSSSTRLYAEHLSETDAKERDVAIKELSKRWNKRK